MLGEALDALERRHLKPEGESKWDPGATPMRSDHAALTYLSRRRDLGGCGSPFFLLGRYLTEKCFLNFLSHIKS
jgi:hypothetical protein